ncbi:adenylate/guanylate cyclase domain-containing protein [Nocardioides humilatus]|uniref:Adenylate/guanylate cyclase domain-containing protein n=1 Tax=Nocardioides humilatus TaxID=2607660 RepID=A0A5B1LM29_9ACTN|nr:adenylate/guanylate cyclase domain-containing protein [Nocardioides humilatus]KAA1421603.1 adenylate/guanylate cyclase domain-containing protein [Nocardioides humilatus]
MSMVTRFIEVVTWPTSRKTALLYGALLPFHLVLETTAYLALRQSGGGHDGLFGAFLIAWIAVIALGCVTGMMLDRRGREGRWTAYVFVALYGAAVVTLIHLFGTMSTGFVVFVPAVVSVWAIFYDWAVAKVGVALLIPALLVVVVLERVGTLPYAPVLEGRALDAQSSGAWYLLMGPAAAGCILFSVTLCGLVVGARAQQDVELVTANARLERSSTLISHYLPAQVAEQILGGPEVQAPVPVRRKLTVFFSDLVDFTDLTESLEPEDLSRVLQEYFTAMTAIADRYDATIDDFIGDAVVVLFGAPRVTDDRDHALRAVRMAAEMQDAMAGLNAGWAAAGIDVRLEARMGISTGMATVGNIGSESRTKYTAVGRSMNLAARLQAQCTPGRVLVSHCTWLLVRDEIDCVAMGEVQLKGIAAPVRVYEVSAADAGSTVVDFPVRGWAASSRRAAPAR